MANLYRVMVTDHAWPYNKLKANATAEENSAVGFLNYKSMSIEEMKKMGSLVREIMLNDSLIFAWGTWPFLKQCIEVHESWGFKYVTCAFAWVKSTRLPKPEMMLNLMEQYKQGKISQRDVERLLNTTPYYGMGRWTASNTEYCLLFKHGKPDFRTELVSQLVVTDELSDGEVKQVEDYASWINPQTLVHPLTNLHSEKPEQMQDRIERISEGPYIELFARRKRAGWLCLGNEISGNDIFYDLTMVKESLGNL